MNSVVGHVGKIVEKEVLKQFLNFLKSHDLISIDQFAFLSNHCTQTCMHRVTDDWYESFNNNELVAACFLDISKCFDSIDIDILLIKLTCYGVKGKEHEWFSSYLHDRSQAVFCHGTLSSFRDVTVGVPQGSILAPILFVLFMNDISQHLKNSCCNVYADDVVIYTSSPNINEASLNLQSDLNTLCMWYNRNKLKINADKTKVMVLSPSKHYDLEIYIDQIRIEQVHTMRYLGVLIDEKLNWNHHIQQLSRSIGYKIYSLNKMSTFMNQDILNLLYLTLIQPCIDYACTVWGHCSRKSVNILSRLQKRAARVITRNFDFINTDGINLVKELKWQVFENRRDYFIATLMFKCIHGIAPTHMVNEIEMVCDRHHHNTRSADSLNVIAPKPNIECFKRSFRFAGAKVWNSLPHDLQNVQSIQSFKKLCKQFLFK